MFTAPCASPSPPATREAPTFPPQASYNLRSQGAMTVATNGPRRLVQPTGATQREERRTFTCHFGFTRWSMSSTRSILSPSQPITLAAMLLPSDNGGAVEAARGRECGCLSCFVLISTEN